MMLRHRHQQAAERKALNLAELEEGSEEGAKASWIELNFRKRECIKFVPSYTHEGHERCGCGRLHSAHHYLDSYDKPHVDQHPNQLGTRVEHWNETAQSSRENSIRTMSARLPSQHHGLASRGVVNPNQSKWHAIQHTAALPTDAHGILEFQGTGEGDKSQYIRLAHDTHQELILRLLTEEWGLQLPKMVITVHGGVHNFQLQPKLRRVFCDGLIKAAKTTGAWIMLFGLNTGVGSIVGNALKEHKAKSRGKICSIGVAPWGVVDNREDLVGSQVISSYQTMANPLSKGAVLHAAHTHFLLVDNGTEGRYDSELKFRRRLERRLSMQQINTKHSRKIPVVCLVLEGGKNTINVVLESVRQTPPIPVIVVDGSGRAADLLAFAHQYAEDDGTMMEELRVQLLFTIQNTFNCEREQAQYIFLTIMECVRRKGLITVFRLGQGQNKGDDIDNAILTASLKARRTSAPDMLSLALTWNRIDIATSQIFVYGQHWPVLSLEQAMMDALTQDRVDFVKLLMENGVSMHKFLTIPRLEDLYNIKQIPVHLLYLLQDVKKNITLGCRFNLIEIGQVIESLMGGAYRCNYTRKRFRMYYANQARTNGTMKKQPSFSKSMLQGNLSKLDMTASIRDFANSTSIGKPDHGRTNNNSPQCQIPKDFQYPFHELMVWAVLMKRQKMALFMWQHGEEAIAKALVAAKLYKTMAREAADDELELEEMEEMKHHASEFQELATQLLEICYRADTDATQHLLTYELKQWSRHTCLSLAIAAQHRDFIAHPCVQLLLNDLWMGGLNVRKNSSLRVILGIVVPPSLFTLQFKSQEELQLMPQTMEEHMDERNDSSSISSSSSSSLSSSTSSSSSSSSSTASSITSGLQPKPEVVGRGATGLDQSNLPPQDAYLVFMAQQRQLSMSKKLYEFYNAPITKFWLYTISYIAFLIMFTYVVLVAMDPMPSVVEWLVIAHTFTLALEKTREVAASEPSGAFHKIRIWCSHFWHRVDIVLLTMFFAAFVLRMLQDQYLLMVGRVVYCVNITLWYTRLLNIFSVSKYLGPYVMMMGKMMVDLGTFIILLAVVLFSFGVTRHAILHPNELPSWSLVRDVLLEPYFMLYGEVYAGTIDPCNGNDDSLCVIGSWIVPTAMTLYLLVANILLLNMLIAVFNNTFTKVKNISDKIWKFHRYGMIVEYESRPVLPPPLIVLSYIAMLVRLCLKKRKNSIFNSDRGLKLFLDDEDVEKLHDFEEECVDDFFRQRDLKLRESSDIDVRKISTERFERFLDYVDDAGDRDDAVTANLRYLDERLAQLEDASFRILKILPHLVDRSNSSGITDSDQYSDDRGMTDFNSLRRRMRFRINRIRQDSEMSMTSDWHPPNILLHRARSHHEGNRERHASEHVTNKIPAEFRLRKTHSTGNITTNGLNPPETVISTTTLATASSHNSSNCRTFPKLLVDQEQKSVSCQDIMMMRDPNVHAVLQDSAPVIHDNVVSGSEFLPSDYVDEPEELRESSQWAVTNEKSKIRWMDNLLGAPAERPDLSPFPRHNKERINDASPEISSGDETSCSSAAESQKYKTTLFGRKKKSPKRDLENRRLLRSKKTSAVKLPTLVINSPEYDRSPVQTHGLTPVESIISPKEKKTTLVRAANTFPTLKAADRSRSPRISDSARQNGTGVNFYYATPPNRAKSNSLGQNTGRKLSRGFSPPRIQFKPSPNANGPQSLYKSITDCIDTSRWHDANTPIPPSTPFENWTNKQPDFMTTRPSRSPVFSVIASSQDEWEDENSTSKKQSKSGASRSHRHGEKRPRRGRSRLYSNNSSSSIKSVSSRRNRNSVRKHRHKKKKRLQKGLIEQMDLKNEDNTAATPSVQPPLTTLPENSPSLVHVTKDTPTGSCRAIFTTAGPSQNVNNSNSESRSSSRDSTARVQKIDEKDEDKDYFMARYAMLSNGNLTINGNETTFRKRLGKLNESPVESRARQSAGNLRTASDEENSPLLP